MSRIALLGATGFVGSHVRAALLQRGAEVRCLAAPRLTTQARELSGVVVDIEEHLRLPQVRALAAAMAECDAVVNAAGAAAATGDGDLLFGANALLPGVLARVTPPGARFVHVSSAAVQGRRRVLDESGDAAAFSPYSSSKALGEGAAWAVRSDAVCYRPTSVHGSGRDLTRSLVRVLGSPIASVAGSGELPTPQVRVENVGDAVAFLASTGETPPRVVLHPSEGLTTAELVRILGGREPLRLPTWLARSVVAGAFVIGRVDPTSAGLARRLEMMWFGQEQGPSWLTERWTPVKGVESWKELA